MSLAQFYDKALLLKEMEHAEEMRRTEARQVHEKSMKAFADWKEKAPAAFVAAVKAYKGSNQFPPTWGNAEDANFDLNKFKPPATIRLDLRECSLIEKARKRIEMIVADKNGAIRLSGDDPALGYIRCR